MNQWSRAMEAKAEKLSAMVYDGLVRPGDGRESGDLPRQTSRTWTAAYLNNGRPLGALLAHRAHLHNRLLRNERANWRKLVSPLIPSL